jgi:hypothetical protein
MILDHHDREEEVGANEQNNPTISGGTGQHFNSMREQAYT